MDDVMRFSYIVTLFAVTLIYTNAFGLDMSPNEPVEKPISDQEQNLMMDCNLAARNSLINGDIAKVERTCKQASDELAKSHPEKAYSIHPMLNLAFTYSLMGAFDKADPILAEAKALGEKFYKPGSREMKNIEDLIVDHNKRKGAPPQFDKGSISSPH